jgi:DNA-directed RNA polymerase subunit RPC12/RpoP
MRWLIGVNKENPFTIEPAGVGSTLISHHPKAVHGMLRESGFSNIKYYGAGVLDRLASKIGFAGRWILPAEHLAPFFAWSKIAPWILCQAIAKGNPILNDVTGIGELLQCPSCGGRISEDKQAYICPICKRHYPVEDGIIDFRM